MNAQHLLPAFVGTPEVNRIYCMDALALLRALPTGSVDAVITDLPYGTTACSWDEIIPFAPMWEGVKRVLKPRGVFVTTASQPFTSKLVMSNLDDFRYEWIWHKTMATGFLNSPHMPLRAHENIIIFGGTMYFPQFTTGLSYTKRQGGVPSDTIRDKTITHGVSCNSGYRHPRSIITFSNADQSNKLHPTQKPLALYDYLIRTYTLPGELVLDFCCGSGTTAVAARNLGRRFIAGDSDAGYCEIARRRLAQPYTPNMFDTLIPQAVTP